MTPRTCWIVCGSRTFNDYAMMRADLDALAAEFGPPTVLVNGAMMGADALSSYWAYERKINTLAYGAQWGTHGGAAGPRRNADMAQQLSADSGRDFCFAFTDKPLAASRGTKDMVGKATAILGGDRVFVFESNGAYPKSAVITPGDGRGQDGTGVVTVHSSNGPADSPNQTSDACPCEPATDYRCPKHEHRAMSQRRFGADPHPSGNAEV